MYNFEDYVRFETGEKSERRTVGWNVASLTCGVRKCPTKNLNLNLNFLMLLAGLGQRATTPRYKKTPTNSFRSARVTTTPHANANADTNTNDSSDEEHISKLERVTENLTPATGDLKEAAQTVKPHTVPIK